MQFLSFRQSAEGLPWRKRSCSGIYYSIIEPVEYIYRLLRSYEFVLGARLLSPLFIMNMAHLEFSINLYFIHLFLQYSLPASLFACVEAQARNPAHFVSCIS